MSSLWSCCPGLIDTCFGCSNSHAMAWNLSYYLCGLFDWMSPDLLWVRLLEILTQDYNSFHNIVTAVTLVQTDFAVSGSSVNYLLSFFFRPCWLAVGKNNVFYHWLNACHMTHCANNRNCQSLCWCRELCIQWYILPSMCNARSWFKLLRPSVFRVKKLESLLLHS